MLELDKLKELLSYDPDTGEFSWLVRRNSRDQKVKPGAVAGNVDGWGYRRIGIFGTRYRASRLAWFYVYGRWPTHLIDHKNGVRDDNRIANLREATYGQNQCNRRPSSNTGYRGVHQLKNGTYGASIAFDRKRSWLGTFKTIEEAIAARAEAAARLHGEFARAA